MSLPETCPFCGSGVDLRNGEKWVCFTCLTTIHAGHDRKHQANRCAVRERARLAQQVTALEAENKTMRDRFSDADTERNAAQAALKAAFARVAELEERCKRLEEAGDRLAAFTPPSSDRFGAWSKAKEAKP